MNLYTIIKILIFLVVILIGLVVWFLARLVNPEFFASPDEKKNPPIEKEKVIKKENSDEDINNSIQKREERIKALKEVGEKLGG